MQKFALGKVADTLAGTVGGDGTVFASDDDPELIRDAVPFALKTIEALIVEVPEHEGLLLAACQGFTQYSGAYVELDRLRLVHEDYRRAKELKQRALNLYLRAQGYCLRALELALPGAVAGLAKEPGKALEGAGAKHARLLFWSAASWGSAISIGLDRPELLADVPSVRALVEKVLASEPTFERGSAQEMMILFESIPAMGGDLGRARAYFDRAVEMGEGKKASPLVTYAEAISVQTQNRQEFEELLNRALALDPRASEPDVLANLISQRKAKILLNQAEDLFFEDEDLD